MLRESGDGWIYDFSDLGFIDSNHDAQDADYMTYDKSTRSLTVTNLLRANNYVQITNFFDNGTPMDYMSYRIQLFYTRTLSFELNNGEGNIDSMKCVVLDDDDDSCSVTIPSTVPTREGYTFLGWADTATATTADDKYTSGKTITLTADKTVYAVWEKDEEVPSTGTTPDTGSNTRNDDTPSMIFSILPGCVIIVGAMLYFVYTKKQRVNF